jgi:hypothetical protein
LTLLAVLVIACSPSPPAAVIDDTEISQDALLDEMEALRGDPENAFFQVGSNESENTYNSDQRAQALSRLVLFQAVESELETQGVPVPAAEGARTSPERSEELVNMLGRTLLGLSPTASLEEVEATVATDPDNFDNPAVPVCISIIGVSSEAEADAAADRIDGGETFEAIAAEVSVRPSASAGGDEGCVPPTVMPPDVLSVVTGIRDGEISLPIETAEGFILIRRDGVDPTGAGQDIVFAEFNSWFSQEVGQMDVVVLDHIGTWSPEAGVVPAR